MPEPQWESTTDHGAAPPQQQWESTGDHADPNSLVGAAAAVFKQYGSGLAEGLNPVTIARGVNDLVQGAFWHPLDTAKNIAASNAQAWEKAKAAASRGDYGSAAAHFINYLMPGGSMVEPATSEIEQNPGDLGHLAHALGTSTAAAITMAAPDSPYVKAAIKALPATVRVNSANARVAAAVKFAQDRGIPVDAGTATQNVFVKGFQKGADHTPIGSIVENRSRAAGDEALGRVSGELMDDANPTSVAPNQAGEDITSALKSNIQQSHATANAAYDEFREIEADPANVRNVQTGTRQVPAKDPKSGMEIPGKFTTEPVFEDVPLPVDMRPAQEALRPIRDAIKRGMPIAEQRASRGLLALDNIIDGPYHQQASIADNDLSAIKEAARNGGMPELRTISQGLAARAVKELQDAVSEAASNAQRAPAGVVKYVQEGDKLIAYDANGDVVSQPAAGVTQSAQTTTPNVPTPEEQLDAGTDARAAQQGPTADQQGGSGPRSSRTEAIVPGSPTSYGATYQIRELRDIQPSHNGQTFAANPQYPLKNDRNYNNAVNQRKVVEWSTPQQFDPRYHITDNADATNGPPLIDSDGNVLGGNGRTMIMQRVYAGNPTGAAAYKSLLEERASQFGLNPAEVAKYDQPVLVRVIDDGELATPGKIQDAITDFNKTGTAALTPAEQAVADARRVSTETLEGLSKRLEELGPEATTAQALEGRPGVDILNGLIRDGVIAPQEAARYATEDALTQAGKQRVTQLLLGRFFRDADQLDSLPAAIRNKVDRIAGPLARLESEGDYAITDHVKSAIDLLETSRAKGLTVEDYLHQGGLFNAQKFSPEAQAIATGLRDGNPTAIARQLNVYAEHAREANAYQGPGMFNDIPDPKNPRQAFNHAFGTSFDEAQGPAAPEPEAAPQRSEGFAQSFEPTKEPPKRTAPSAGAQLGTPAGKEALDALARGRAATRAKWATDEVLKALPKQGDEPRMVFDSALWAKDAGISQLRRIAREAPQTMPRLARAYLEDTFSSAAAEGGWRKAAGTFEKWQALGPQTKQLLFPNPMQRADLDNFFLIAKKMGENVNPSGSTTTAVSLASAGAIFRDPKAGIPMVIGAGALSGLMHSPAFVRAITDGIQIPLRNTARATIAVNRILRIAGEAAQPANNVIEFPGAGKSPSQQSDQLPRASNQ